MCTRFQFVIRFLLVTCLVNTTLAQDNRPAADQRTALTITASASSERVRFTAPSSVVQIRLEVYNSSGRKVFDNEVRGGNVLDWRLQDGQAEPLAEDTYLCVVMAKSLSGRITQRIGWVTVVKNGARVQAVDASQMTARQVEAIGPVEENASLNVVKEGEPLTGTVIAHNGEEGQVVRGRGALSFRLGDFFGGKDIEQMRLTAEGNLGIGVASPQAKLDVAGAIRASQGILFPDGSIQFSAARKTFGTASHRGSQAQDLAQGEEPRPAIAGSGTTGQIPKWLDGPSGVLGDSVITELNGSIGINGPPNPIFKLDVNGHNRFRGSNVSFSLTGVKPGGNDWLFQTVDADGRLRIFDGTSSAERFRITQSGNVGIGDVAPSFRLHVVTPANVGLRVQTNALGGSVASFGGNGDFQIDAVNVPGGRLNVKENGNVGVGTPSPQAKLDVRGDVKLGSSGQLFAPGGEENLRIIRGAIDAQGNTLVGSGFRAIRTDTGKYTITFNTSFAGAPAVTCTGEFGPSTGQIFVMTDGVTTAGANLIVANPAVGNLINSPFHFIAIGPR